jgi:hypothetical protein
MLSLSIAAEFLIWVANELYAKEMTKFTELEQIVYYLYVFSIQMSQ